MCDFIGSLHWLNKKLSGLCFEVCIYIYTHSLHVIIYTCQYVHCIYGFSIQKKWCFKPRHKSGGFLLIRQCVLQTPHGCRKRSSLIQTPVAMSIQQPIRLKMFNSWLARLLPNYIYIRTCIYIQYYHQSYPHMFQLVGDST